MGGEPIKPTAGLFIIQLGCVLLKTRSGLVESCARTTEQNLTSIGRIESEGRSKVRRTSLSREIRSFKAFGGDWLHCRQRVMG